MVRIALAEVGRTGVLGVLLVDANCVHKKLVPHHERADGPKHILVKVDTNAIQTVIPRVAIQRTSVCARVQREHELCCQTNTRIWLQLACKDKHLSKRVDIASA